MPESADEEESSSGAVRRPAVGSEVFPLERRPLCPGELVNELAPGAIAAEVVMSAGSGNADWQPQLAGSIFSELQERRCRVSNGIRRKSDEVRG